MDSLREAMAISRRMNQMLDDAFGFDLSRPESWDEVLRPSADLVETEKEFVFRIELPGVLKDEIDVEADSGTITVRGQKRYEREADQQRYLRMECGYGRFERRFQLPNEIDPDAVAAKFENGILTVRVAKIKSLEARRVEIEG